MHRIYISCICKPNKLSKFCLSPVVVNPNASLVSSSALLTPKFGLKTVWSEQIRIFWTFKLCPMTWPC